jgi:hypothetical protein
MNSTDTTQQSPRPLRNVDLCKQINALRHAQPATAQPIFPDADAVPAALNADAGLRQLFRRPVTVPWLANSDAYRSLAE